MPNKTKTICKFKNPKSFGDFVNALQPFIGRDKPYFLLESTDGKTVVGYACDGYRFAKQVYENKDVSVTEPFSVYLPPLYITTTQQPAPIPCRGELQWTSYLNLDHIAVVNNPVNVWSNVCIEKDEDGAIHLRVESITMEAVQPENPMDFHRIYETLQKPAITSTRLNRSFLADAIDSFQKDPREAIDSVVVEMRGRLDALKISKGKNERYVLPISESKSTYR